MNIEQGAQDTEIDDDLDVEIEIEDDTPLEDQGREPMPKEVADDFENDELEEYDDRVKQRLKQAKKLFHDERRERERVQREHQEAITLAKRFYDENRSLKSTLNTGQKSLVESYQSTAQMEAEKARREYREAYEAGDSEKLVEAQDKMQEANLKLHQLRNYRPTSFEDENVVLPQQEQPIQAPKPDAETLAWQERNQWYGSDAEMTASALGLHQKLVQENGGQYAGTEEYWQAIDKTMRRRFPEHFGESDKTEKTPSARARATNVVAPASRSTSAKKIVLTKSQVSIAKRLGLTPEQYAQEMRKLEKNNG